MDTIPIGVVGFGKIAHDQHLPALLADPAYRVVAITQGTFPAPPGIAVFESLDEMLARAPQIEAVSLCTPPQSRHALARRAIDRGRHVLLEKPPGRTLSEVADLTNAARAAGTALFAAWHSREAPGVQAAREWLAGSSIREVRITWREDVRHWHPGQSWIWQPGGFGVFDPGINAFSIATRILPRAIFPTAAVLTFPANRAAPIAARVELTDCTGVAMRAEFDWRATQGQIWQISVATDRGDLCLDVGGARLAIDGALQPLAASAEYPRLYARFAQLVQQRGIDADVAPLRLVADAFALGERLEGGAFHDREPA